MISDQVRFSGGSDPSSSSVAWPENGMLCPTFHVSVERGVSMTGTGGVSPAEIVKSELLVVPPWSSLTRTEGWKVPTVSYSNVGLASVESPKGPSPARSQEYVSGSPSGSVEPDASKLTVSGTIPLSGVALAWTTGGWF